MKKDLIYPDYETIRQLAIENHKAQVEKGFWDQPTTFRAKMALVRGEAYEAVEAYRKGRSIEKELAVLDIEHPDFFKKYGETIKGSIEEEIADMFIRLLDTYGAFLHGAPEKVAGYEWTLPGHTEESVVANLIAPALEPMDDFEEFRDPYTTDSMSMFERWKQKPNATFIDVLDRTVEEMFSTMVWDQESMRTYVVFCIRLTCQLAFAYEIKLMPHVYMKMAYNNKRPYKHGKIV